MAVLCIPSVFGNIQCFTFDVEYVYVGTYKLSLFSYNKPSPSPTEITLTLH